MGLVLVILAVAAIVFVAAPALAIGLVVLTRADREPPFWSSCALATFVSFAGQYGYALAPFSFLRTREYSWELLMGPMLGWHLAAPPIVAALFWAASRRFRSPAANGLVTGLLFSVALVVVLAIPIGLTLPALLGLRFRP
ncbi:MAG: hypothetical protein ACHQM4_07840 [Thermoanaerobaculia bacterium]